MNFVAPKRINRVFQSESHLSFEAIRFYDRQGSSKRSPGRRIDAKIAHTYPKKKTNIVMIEKYKRDMILTQKITIYKINHWKVAPYQEFKVNEGVVDSVYCSDMGGN